MRLSRLRPPKHAKDDPPPGCSTAEFDRRQGFPRQRRLTDGHQAGGTLALNRQAPNAPLLRSLKGSSRQRRYLFMIEIVMIGP
jgi:hypothetical protein